MKKISGWIAGIFTILIFAISLSLPANVYADDDVCTGANVCLCDPDASCCSESQGQQCDTGGGGCTSDAQCNGTDVCCQGVCVGANQCGGGGGGGTAPNTCPSGTVYTCATPVIHSCLIQGTACAWPRRRGALCNETGSEANGNLREWYWCQSNCSCVSTCTAVAPSSFNLTSPADGASLTSTTVTFGWQSATFGTACSGANNTYKVYVGTTSNPTTLVATIN